MNRNDYVGFIIEDIYIFQIRNGTASLQELAISMIITILQNSFFFDYVIGTFTNRYFCKTVVAQIIECYLLTKFKWLRFIIANQILLRTKKGLT